MINPHAEWLAKLADFIRDALSPSEYQRLKFCAEMLEVLDGRPAEPVAAPKCSCKFESTPNSMSVTTDPNCPLHARYLWQNEAPEKSDGPAPLVGALQDKVHEDTGAVRVGRSVKAAVEPDERHCIDQLEPRFECHVCGRKYRTAEVRDHHQEECKDAAESWRSLKSEEQQPDKWAALRGDQWTPAEMSRLRQRNRAPAEHEWDADGKCKWCPAERTNEQSSYSPEGESFGSKSSGEMMDNSGTHKSPQSSGEQSS